MQCGMVRMLMKELKELLDVLPKWALHIFLFEGSVSPLSIQLIKHILNPLVEKKHIQERLLDDWNCFPYHDLNHILKGFVPLCNVNIEELEVRNCRKKNVNHDGELSFFLFSQRAWTAEFLCQGWICNIQQSSAFLQCQGQCMPFENFLFLVNVWYALKGESF